MPYVVPEQDILRIVRDELENFKEEFNEEKAHAQLSVANAYKSLEKYKAQIKNDLILQTRNLFENSEFMQGFRDQVFRFIEQEIKLQLSQQGLRAVITEELNFVMKEKLQDSVRTVVDTILKKVNAKLTYDLKKTKELVMSIDTEVQHCLIKLPISASSNERIKQAIYSTIDKMMTNKENKLLLTQEDE